MDEQPQDDVPNSGTLEGTTTNAPQQNDQNAFGQNVVYVRQKSQIPKVFGAFMMIYGVIVGLFGIIGVIGTGGVISDYENAGIEISGLQTGSTSLQSAVVSLFQEPWHTEGMRLSTTREEGS